VAIEPIPFPEANVSLNPPPGMENCTTLDIHRTKDGIMISKWRLTTDEIQRIQETGHIWLFVFGKGHPPVAMLTQDPFHV